ncbi:uncharacterized protein TAF1C-like [Drosophila bipectinata]|uniref:uncharacterized protein TAF1C-like n=1 Tax=Drosophila bipectinata TaxID=42026 RepID=UPI001C892B84|nr:uncharacterized protein LOC108118795 [Drosophila bipectinata]
MPRCFEKSLLVAKLSALKNSKTSDHDSDSGSDFEEDPAENNLQFNLQTLHNTCHSTHPSENLGMLGQQLKDQGMHAEQVFPNCMVTVPVPLFVAKDGHTPGLEPCHQRTQNHYDWLRLLHKSRTRFERRTKKMKQREKKQSLNVYDKSIFDLAEQIARQDNPHFRDNYDYYYTGGNLNTMPFQLGSMAMHASGPNLRDLHFSEVKTEAEMWTPKLSMHMEEASSEIFQILPLKSFQDDHENMLLTRFLKEVVLYELKEKETEDEELSYELVCQSKYSCNEAPFISAAQSWGDPKTLALASQDRSLRFVNIETQQDIAKHDVCLLKGLQQTASTWAQLLPASGSTFHYLTQPVLLTVDVRCDKPINPCFASSVHSRNCETFSSLARSANPNLLYVASNHKLHCLDLRCLGKKLTDRSVVTWTHQMTFPPCFLDTFAHDSSEYVALSGLVPNDQRICEMKGYLAESVDEMFSPALPYQPPTLEEALMEARLNGYVDIYADLTERVKACTTGMRFSRLERTSDDAFAQLLTANSLGDVYCQRMSLRENDELIQEMRTGLHTTEAIRYCGEVVQERVERQKLRCTDVQTIPEIREILRDGAKLPEVDEKPTIVEYVDIDYGIPDSEDSDSKTESSKESFKKKKKKIKKEKNIRKGASPKKNKSGKQNFQKDRGISRGPWQKSAYQLSRYTDMLSVQLLDIWDMEEFDHTRDVSREMLQERLEDSGQEPEARMADWLNKLPMKPEKPHDEDDGRPNVPGTSLPKVYTATTAEFTKVTDEEIEEGGLNTSLPPMISPKKELSEMAKKRLHSTLLPGQYTVIECGYSSNPTPVKKPKKYVKGF